MDATAACGVLAEAGVQIAPGRVRVEPRDNRWAAHLPDERMAWFPMNAAGAQYLAREARVLELLAARCHFAVPRVLFASPAGWQLRRMVSGVCDPWGLYRRTRQDRGLARRTGQSIGAILAAQHAAVQAADVAGWLPEGPPWPEPLEVIRTNLPRVIDDAAMLRRIGHALSRYEAMEAGHADRVLVHGDLGFHNLALDPATDAVCGVFDYGDASWSDRHQDFRYLVFPEGADEAELDGALDAYEPIMGVRLDRSRIRLCNAACAIGFLAHRAGAPPNARPCGRTLAEDLDWVQWALLRIGLD